MTMRYTHKELVILKVIAKEKARGNLVISMDDIVNQTEHVLDPHGDQANFRGGVSATVRNLQRKVGELGITIYPNGQVGRGHKAYVSVTGDFDAAVERIEELRMKVFRVKYIDHNGDNQTKDEVADTPEAATKRVRDYEKAFGRTISVLTCKKVKAPQTA